MRRAQLSNMQPNRRIAVGVNDCELLAFGGSLGREDAADDGAHPKRPGTER
jgi:hypothetical protein